MCWRPCPFEVGRVYSVLKSFKSLSFEFTLGQRFTFESEGYNRYDSTTIYNFRSEKDAQIYQWWLHDDVPLETWKEFLEPTSQP
jgi:hypothetical protein